MLTHSVNNTSLHLQGLRILGRSLREPAKTKTNVGHWPIPSSVCGQLEVGGVVLLVCFCLALLSKFLATFAFDRSGPKWADVRALCVRLKHTNTHHLCLAFEIWDGHTIMQKSENNICCKKAKIKTAEKQKILFEVSLNGQESNQCQLAFRKQVERWKQCDPPCLRRWRLQIFCRDWISYKTALRKQVWETDLCKTSDEIFRLLCF